MPNSNLDNNSQHTNEQYIKNIQIFVYFIMNLGIYSV